LLAMMGIYGVLAHTVSQRTREIGVRMALGADAAAVTQMVVRQGISPAAIGIVVGSAIAVALGRLVASLLFDVSPADAVSFAAAAVLLASAAAAACIVPARQATKVDPATALRHS
jgi:ABC-type antimicrobial peptide transport system permease subunit